MLDLLGFFLNLSNYTKMTIRLFMPPSFLFISGLLLQTFIDSSLQRIYNTEYSANTVHVANLTGQVLYYFDIVALLIMFSGLLSFIWQTYKLWQCENGKLDNFCHTCGGIVVEKSGRWGDYHHCLACGNNRSIR